MVKVSASGVSCSAKGSGRAESIRLSISLCQTSFRIVSTSSHAGNHGASRIMMMIIIMMIRAHFEPKANIVT